MTAARWPEDQSNRLRNAGTNVQNAFWDYLQGGADNIQGDLTREVATRLLEALRANPNLPDIATPINAIGQDIDNALHPNLHNIWVGAITVQQPVFVGGKIIYSNQMAVLAQQLSEAKYDMKEADVLLDVDQAYWQIISIANKKKLAESYVELLEEMEKDVQTAVNAGARQGQRGPHDAHQGHQRPHPFQDAPVQAHRPSAGQCHCPCR